MAAAVFPMWGERVMPSAGRGSVISAAAAVGRGALFSRRRVRQSAEVRANDVINSVETFTAAIDRKASL